MSENAPTLSSAVRSAGGDVELTETTTDNPMVLLAAEASPSPLSGRADGEELSDEADEFVEIDFEADRHSPNLASEDGDAGNDPPHHRSDNVGAGTGLGKSRRRRSSGDDAAFGEGANLVEVRGWREKLKAKVLHYLFDPTLPPEVQVFRRENICIALCYVVVGLFQGISSGVMNVYPLELGATEAQQTTIKVLRAMPATFKLVYGFVSDAFPIFGYRRKGYMLIGWSIASTAMALLTLTPTPTIPFLSFMYLLFGFGFWVADVMADALVAEKAKLEPEGRQGNLQSTCYALRFFFLMIGVVVATYMYEVIDVHVIFAFLALCPVALILLPWTWLHEERYAAVLPVREQLHSIWRTISSRSVFQPMAFVYLFNAVQFGNAAWNQFLYTVLEFSTAQLNSILVISEVLLFVGVVTYKQYMRGWSWRNVYWLVIGLNAIFSVLQIMLIYQTNRKLGVPDFWFALGDEAMVEFAAGIQFLPCTIMMVHLCPKGNEGVSYAMFTTMNNVALNLSSNLSTTLLGIWDVSKETLAKGDLSGLVKLTILTTCMQTSGAFFLPLLPKYKRDLEALEGHGHSRRAGIVFLTVLGLSMLFMLITAFLNILLPGWSGET